MAKVAILGATGAVGGVLRELLRDWDDVRYFASARSAGTELDGRTVGEATPKALESGGFDVCFSAIGATASLELVPHAVRGGAVAIDKSSAWRMKPDVPLVVPGEAVATAVRALHEAFELGEEQVEAEHPFGSTGAAA